MQILNDLYPAGANCIITIFIVESVIIFAFSGFENPTRFSNVAAPTSTPIAVCYSFEIKYVLSPIPDSSFQTDLST